MPSSVLLSLAATPATELCRKTPTGERPVKTLYEQSLQEGLCNTVALDDVERLHAVFDLALRHGFGCVILDYVTEVCSDPACSSSDPLESTLLDGRCLKRWCQSSVDLLWDGAKSSLGLASLASPIAAANSLVLVAQALSQPDKIIAGPSVSQDALLLKAVQLKQFLQVAEWAARQQLDLGSGFGRFASHQQWVLSLDKRRSASASGSALLQELLDTLTQLHGCSGLTYPPRSSAAGLQSLFLQGATDPAAWHAKLALLLYYTLDTGLSAPPTAFWQEFGVLPGTYAEWRVRFLLDDAASGLPSSPASLQEACQLLPVCASLETSFSLLEALALLGRPQAALAALKTRAAGLEGSTLQGLTLHQMQAAVRIHLSCGAMAEAFLEIRQHCSGEADSQRQREHCTAAMEAMIQWAAANKALDQVVQLPFDSGEEQVVLQALQGLRGPAAQLLPLFWLQRGHLANAALAQARLDEQGRSSSSTDKLRQRRQQLLADAAPAMPSAQRSLVITPSGIHEAPSAFPEPHGSQLPTGAVSLGRSLGAAQESQGAATILVQGQAGGGPAPLLGVDLDGMQQPAEASLRQEDAHAEPLGASQAGSGANLGRQAVPGSPSTYRKPQYRGSKRPRFLVTDPEANVGNSRSTADY